jgi:hypothetical protein
MEWRKALTKVSLLDINIFKSRRLKSMKGGETMKGIWAFMLVLVFFSFSLSGCAYFAAQNEIKAAEKATADLKGAGGATLAPYEYCSAESFLEISKFVLTENSWKVSREFSARSRSAAEAGLAEVKKKK